MPTIFPLTAVVYRLDIVTMGTSGDYDNDFKSVKKVDLDGDGLGTSRRKEKAAVQFPAQVENDQTELQRMTGDGDIPRTAVGLVVDVHELAALAAPLYDLATGEFAFRNGDRLFQALSSDGSVSQSFARVPIYLQEIKRLNGFLGSFGNLTLLVYDDWPQGARS